MSDDFQRFLIPKNESDYEINSNYFEHNQTPLRTLQIKISQGKRKILSQ
jgi:uncharacterized protein YozE (UPF0346 family)